MSPAVGNCSLYDALEGFPPGGVLQRKKVFLKGKDETPSSALHAAVLPRKAPKVHKRPNFMTSPSIKTYRLCVKL